MTVPGCPQPSSRASRRQCPPFVRDRPPPYRGTVRTRTLNGDTYICYHGGRSCLPLPKLMVSRREEALVRNPHACLPLNPWTQSNQPDPMDGPRVPMT